MMAEATLDGLRSADGHAVEVVVVREWSFQDPIPMSDRRSDVRSGGELSGSAMRRHLNVACMQAQEYEGAHSFTVTHRMRIV